VQRGDRGLQHGDLCGRFRQKQSSSYTSHSSRSSIMLLAVFICSLDRRAGQAHDVPRLTEPWLRQQGSAPVMRDGNDARERGYLMGHVDHVIMSRLRFAIASRTNLRIRPLRSISSSRRRSRSYGRRRPYQTPGHALRERPGRRQRQFQETVKDVSVCNVLMHTAH